MPSALDSLSAEAMNSCTSAEFFDGYRHNQSCRGREVSRGTLRSSFVQSALRSSTLYYTKQHTHTHTQHTFNGSLSRTTRVSRYRKVKPIWILLKQETVSGSGISWAICKSAPHSRQITTPAPHRSSFLQTGCPSWCPTNSIKALKAYQTKQQHSRHYQAMLHACSAQLQPIVTHAAWSWSVCMSVGHNLRHTKKRINRSKCHLGWNQVGPINHIGPNPPQGKGNLGGELLASCKI